MKIYVPFNRLRSHTYKALSGLDPTYIPHAHATYGYAEYFKRSWQMLEGFINIEQDIITTSYYVQSMMYCDSPICFSGHRYLNGMTEPGYHLSCCKFTTNFIKNNRDLFDDKLPMDRVQLQGLIWRMAQCQPQVCHHGYVLHLNDPHRWTEEERLKYGP